MFTRNFPLPFRNCTFVSKLTLSTKANSPQLLLLSTIVLRYNYHSTGLGRLLWDQHKGPRGTCQVNCHIEPLFLRTPSMSETSLDGKTLSGRAEHAEGDLEASRIHEKLHNRSDVAKDLPLEEALTSHLDDDPKRLRRIRRRVDARLTIMLAVLYLFAFIDRANLGNVGRRVPIHLTSTDG